MRATTLTNKFATAILLGLILLIAMPTLAFAQGRGRGRGRDKKAEKFINGHDARDGRIGIFLAAIVALTAMVMVTVSATT
jgi:hypothetical protein